MINKVNCQNDTDLRRFSQLTQRGRSFWLCFTVLREFSGTSVTRGGRACDCTAMICEFLKNLSGLSLRR